MEQRLKTHPRFAKADREDKQNAREQYHSTQAFCKSGKGGAKPKNPEPKPAKFLMLVTANNAVDRRTNEESAKSVRRDRPSKHESACRTKENQTRSEAAQITRESFPD